MLSMLGALRQASGQQLVKLSFLPKVGVQRSLQLQLAPPQSPASSEIKPLWSESYQAAPLGAL
jgi:hypothetical protein